MLKKSISYVALATSLVVTSTPFANNDLPDIGTAAAGTLTIDQEIQYGDAYMRMLRSSKPILNDPVINEYVTNLGHRLVTQANDVKTPFNFFLIRDKEINAFAFFGGYVALNSGLFLYASSESELASVVAHEIAHITQRHLARSMEEQAKLSAATVSAVVGSLLLTLASPEAGIAALTTTTAAVAQNSINYTRSNEKEADQIGIVTMSKAGFDTSAMPTFFGRLLDKYRYSTTLPAMLSTHPLAEDRVTDSRERARLYPTKSVAPSINYHLAKSRIIARHVSLTSKSALDWYERRINKGSKSLLPAYQYGQALVYLDTKKLDQAEKLLLMLNKQEPGNNFYLDALADLYLAKKENASAIKLLKSALDKKPNNPVLTINYANVLITDENYQDAISILQKYTYANPNDTIGWQLLAEAEGKQGNDHAMLAARGEILALKANWDKAIENYSKASQQVELGSLQQARYDARIDQLMIQRERFQSLNK